MGKSGSEKENDKNPIIQEEKGKNKIHLYCLMKCDMESRKSIMDGAKYLFLISRWEDKKKKVTFGKFVRVYTKQVTDSIQFRIGDTNYWACLSQATKVSMYAVYEAKIWVKQSIADEILKEYLKREQIREQKKKKKTHKKHAYVNVHSSGSKKKTPTEPSYISWNAAHPYGGGGFSPK